MKTDLQLIVWRQCGGIGDDAAIGREGDAIAALQYAAGVELLQLAGDQCQLLAFVVQMVMSGDQPAALLLECLPLLLQLRLTAAQQSEFSGSLDLALLLQTLHRLQGHQPRLQLLQAGALLLDQLRALVFQAGLLLQGGVVTVVEGALNMVLLALL